MRKEGLKDVDELQSYMIRRIETFLNAKGRRLLGWDEILEGGLAPDATVMSWRGTEGGIAAATAGHHAVMTPSNYCYLDFCQDDPTTEPVAAAAFLTLEQAYSYGSGSRFARRSGRADDPRRAGQPLVRARPDRRACRAYDVAAPAGRRRSGVECA